MTDELAALIEGTRHYRMTPREREQQAISFAYGNGHVEDPRVSREGVARIVMTPRRRVGVWCFVFCVL
jgi:hypothetical protein